VALAPDLAVVVAPRLAQPVVLPVRAHLEAAVAPVRVQLLPLRARPLLRAPLVLAVRAHLVLLALLALVRAVVVLPVLAVEAVPLRLLSRQSF